VINTEDDPIRDIFKTAPTFGLRVSILVILSLICIFLDRNNAGFHQWREQAETAVTPIRTVVNKPIKWIYQISQGLTLQKNLVEENDHLRIKEIVLQSQMQKLLKLQGENKQLQALLSSSHNVTGRVSVAQLLAVSLDPALHQLILNKGLHQKVYIGQPVFDAYGVMGQVVDVADDTSKVLLVTDSRSAIPVQDHRNGIRAVVVGTGDNQTLKLVNVPVLSNIKTGDIFVTSGYGQHFPQGYPVGVVISVSHREGQQFLQVQLLPSAHLDQTQRVLIVWPGQLKIRKQVEKLLKQQSFPLPRPTKS
jgi:rod shape-determining protein MreC